MLKPVVFLAFFFSFSLSAQHGNYIYKTIAMRAAPGQLQSLIDQLKIDMDSCDCFPGEKPQLMRHSQGDQWDLLMIIPVGLQMTDYYSEDLEGARDNSLTQGKNYGDEYYDLISWQEEGFYRGPQIRLFNNRFRAMDYYHVEMFQALSGKQSELLEQRKMENVYLDEIDRAPNFIFTKIMGSPVDIFTVGLYRDIKHFAESADISIDDEDRAAKKAGFESVYTIGTYLRSLLLKHRDTLAGAVRVNN